MPVRVQFPANGAMPVLKSEVPDRLLVYFALNRNRQEVAQQILQVAQFVRW